MKHLLLILFTLLVCHPALGIEAGPANSVLRVPSGGGKAKMGAVNLTSTNAVTGQLGVPNGGTGVGTVTLYNLLYGNGTGAMSAVAAGSQYQSLTAGAAGIPTWNAVALNQSAAVSGQLAVANGGTGLSAVGTDGQDLVSNGSANAYQTKISPTDLINIGLASSVSSNILTITLQTQAGNAPSTTDPARLMFRNSTASNGTFVTRSVTGTIAISVPASASLGCANTIACDVYVYALDNAGVVELAVASSYWTEDLQTTTTISSSATSAATLYSNTGRTSKAVRFLGIINITEAVAGTWASGANNIKLAPYLKLELGPQLWAGVYTSGGTSVTTTSGTVADIPTSTGMSVNVVGNATSVTNDYRLRVTYYKPGRFQLISSFTARALSSVSTACEFYTVGLQTMSYGQVSQSNSTNDGPFFGVTLTGWFTSAIWGGQTDQKVQWRRTAGSGTCELSFASAGGPMYHTMIFWPMINGT